MKRTLELVTTRLKRNKKLEKLVMHSLSVQAAFIFVTIIASGFVFNHSDVVYAILMTQLIAFSLTVLIGWKIWEDWL